MRRLVIAAAALTAAFSAATVAQAEPLRLNVKPRSWLDPGNVVAPYSSPNPASAQGQMISYLANPPYVNMKDRFGEGVLPDPVTNGPFIGARNPWGPVDYQTLFEDR